MICRPRDGFRRCRTRIDDLREIASDEGLPFDERSATDALAFAATIHATVRPSAFLLGNGNIRLFWDNEEEEQIGLQFLGDDAVQYVLFSRRGDRLARAMGDDQGAMILRFISASGLRHLLER